MRRVSLALSLVYFFTNAAFAHQVETNLWSERRNALQEQKRSPGQESLQLAALPASFQGVDTSRILNAFPSPASRLLSQQTASLSKTALDRYPSLVGAVSGLNGNIRNITLPSGRDTGKTIFYIQDIHRNAEAQANISKTIQELIDHKQVTMVALEGGFKPIDFSTVSAFPYPNSMKAIADYLLRENIITGAVHAAFASRDNTPVFVGVDERTHYFTNVDAYKKSAPHISEDKERLANLEKRLGEEKENGLNPALLAFDRNVENYRRGSLTVGAYVRELGKAARKTSAVDHFLRALDMEERLDFPRMEQERAQLLERLTAKLHKEQLSDLIAHSVAYRSGRLGHTDFYQYLEALCREGGVPLANYPTMNAYIRYVLLSDELNSEKLLSDLKKMESAAYASLIRTPREKSLIDEERQLYLVGKLLDFSLTSEEWAEYRELKTTRHPGMSLAGIMEEHSQPVVGDSGLRHAGMTDSSNSLASFESFYREAIARNDAITANLLNAMDKNHAKVAVLVTGGFHSPGITERLKNAGVATIAFVPKISKVENGSATAYLSVFTQEKTPLDRLFQGEKLFVSQLQITDVFPALRVASLHARLQGVGSENLPVLGGDRLEITREGREVLDTDSAGTKYRERLDDNGAVTDYQILPQETKNGGIDDVSSGPHNAAFGNADIGEDDVNPAVAAGMTNSYSKEDPHVADYARTSLDSFLSRHGLSGLSLSPAAAQAMERLKNRLGDGETVEQALIKLLKRTKVWQVRTDSGFFVSSDGEKYSAGHFGFGKNHKGRFIYLSADDSGRYPFDYMESTVIISHELVHLLFRDQGLSQEGVHDLAQAIHHAVSEYKLDEADVVDKKLDRIKRELRSEPRSKEWVYQEDMYPVLKALEELFRRIGPETNVLLESPDGTRHVTPAYILRQTVYACANLISDHWITRDEPRSVFKWVEMMKDVLAKTEQLDGHKNRLSLYVVNSNVITRIAGLIEGIRNICREQIAEYSSNEPRGPQATPESASGYIAGPPHITTQADLDAWEKEIAARAESVRQNHPDIVRMVQDQCALFFYDHHEEDIRRILASERIDPAAIDGVIAALRAPQNSFVFFESRVLGADRYLLGSSRALAVDVLRYLQEQPEGNALVREYILHEALERIPNVANGHRGVIRLADLILRRHPAFDPMRQAPGLTKLGRVLRAFINGRVATLPSRDKVTALAQALKNYLSFVKTNDMSSQEVQLDVTLLTMTDNEILDAFEPISINPDIWRIKGEDVQVAIVQGAVVVQSPNSVDKAVRNPIRSEDVGLRRLYQLLDSQRRSLDELADALRAFVETAAGSKMPMPMGSRAYQSVARIVAPLTPEQIRRIFRISDQDAIIDTAEYQVAIRPRMMEGGGVTMFVGYDEQTDDKKNPLIPSNGLFWRQLMVPSGDLESWPELHRLTQILGVAAPARQAPLLQPRRIDPVRSHPVTVSVNLGAGVPSGDDAIEMLRKAMAVRSSEKSDHVSEARGSVSPSAESTRLLDEAITRSESSDSAKPATPPEKFRQIFLRVVNEHKNDSVFLAFLVFAVAFEQTFRKRNSKAPINYLNDFVGMNHRFMTTDYALIMNGTSPLFKELETLSPLELEALFREMGQKSSARETWNKAVGMLFPGKPKPSGTWFTSLGYRKWAALVETLLLGAAMVALVMSRQNSGWFFLWPFVFYLGHPFFRYLEWRFVLRGAGPLELGVGDPVVQELTFWKSVLTVAASVAHVAGVPLPISAAIFSLFILRLTVHHIRLNTVSFDENPLLLPTLQASLIFSVGGFGLIAENGKQCMGSVVAVAVLFGIALLATEVMRLTSVATRLRRRASAGSSKTKIESDIVSLDLKLQSLGYEIDNAMERMKRLESYHERTASWRRDMRQTRDAFFKFKSQFIETEKRSKQLKKRLEKLMRWDANTAVRSEPMTASDVDAINAEISRITEKIETVRRDAEKLEDYSSMTKKISRRDITARLLGLERRLDQIPNENMEDAVQVVVADIKDREGTGIRESDAFLSRLPNSVRLVRISRKNDHGLRILLAFALWTGGAFAQARETLPQEATHRVDIRVVGRSPDDLQKMDDWMKNQSTIREEDRRPTIWVINSKNENLKEKAAELIRRYPQLPACVMKEGEPGFQRKDDGTYDLRDLFIAANQKKRISIFTALAYDRKFVRTNIRVDIISPEAVPYSADDELAGVVWFPRWSVSLTTILKAARLEYRMA